MKRVTRIFQKRRHKILAGFLLLISIYIIPVSAIYANFIRHSDTYEKLFAAAKANGHYTDGWRAHDPPNLFEFKGTTNTFLNWRDEPTGYTGFKNENDQVVIPATFRSTPGFYEGLASVSFDDETRGFINPDGSIAFRTGKDTTMGFVNGRAMMHRLTTSSTGKNDLDYGFIDKDGNLIAEIKYQYAEPFVGEPGMEYALVDKDGFLTPIKKFFTKNSQESISLYDFLIPTWSPIFIDKHGNTAPISEVRASIRRLEDQAKLKQSQ